MQISALVIFLAILLPGCASWSTYNKQRDFIPSAPSVVFVDAKQRAVISNQLEGTNKLRRFCAEPSPDALSAIAATAGLNLSVPTKGDLGYSQAFAEGAASIGLRTQSIQLLRDVMFTNCEAFINEGITSFGLETMQRRFQSTMVAVLAIEQLTGPVKAPVVSLGGQSAANSAEVLDSAIKLVAATEASAKAAKTKLDTDDAAAVTAKAEFDAYVKAHDGDTKSTEYLAAKQKSEKAEAAAKESKDVYGDRAGDLEAARAVRLAATTAGGAGSVKVVFAPDSVDTKMDAVRAAAVSSAVVDIVKNTLELGFGREVCTTLFGQMMSPDARENQDTAKFKETCLNYLGVGVEINTVELERYKKETENIGRLTALIERTMDAALNGKIDQKRADKLIDALIAQLKTYEVSQAKPVSPPPIELLFSKLPDKSSFTEKTMNVPMPLLGK